MTHRRRRHWLGKYSCEIRRVSMSSRSPQRIPQSPNQTESQRGAHAIDDSEPHHYRVMLESPLACDRDAASSACSSSSSLAIASSEFDWASTLSVSAMAVSFLSASPSSSSVCCSRLAAWLFPNSCAHLCTQPYPAIS